VRKRVSYLEIRTIGEVCDKQQALINPLRTLPVPFLAERADFPSC